MEPPPQWRGGMVIEAALITLLSMESRNGGDCVERFIADGSPFVSTRTRRLGAVAGVVYDRRGQAHEIGGDATVATSPCTAVPAVRRRSAAPARATVDVMELYTTAAETGAGGRAQIEAKIAAAVDVLNTTLQQSRVDNVAFRLVYVGPIGHDERGTALDQLIWLSGDAEVAKLREEHGADLVGLWTDGPGSIAWVPQAFDRSRGFHVVSRRYPLALQYYSHEVGHNLGAQHNAEVVGAVAGDLYPYARGTVAATWMTVMSYPPPGDWRDILPLFSNPDLSHDGVPVGVEGRADNARMLRIGGPIVAAYTAAREP